MRRERKHHQHHHRDSAGKQRDLFGSSHADPAAQAPAWNTLPPQTRTVLTELISRLILSHAQNGRRAQIGGRRHDV